MESSSCPKFNPGDYMKGPRGDGDEIKHSLPTPHSSDGSLVQCSRNRAINWVALLRGIQQD